MKMTLLLHAESPSRDQIVIRDQIEFGLKYDYFPNSRRLYLAEKRFSVPFRQSSPVPKPIKGENGTKYSIFAKILSNCLFHKLSKICSDNSFPDFFF